MKVKTLALLGMSLMILTVGVSVTPLASASPPCDANGDSDLATCATWTAECLATHVKTPAWCYPPPL